MRLHQPGKGKQMSNAKQKALIYCRVSDTKQKTEGHGLESQEHRCRQYALEKGYEIEAVFPDDISGGGDFMKRPGMTAMLGYMERNAHTNYVVIFDDLKRFARDTVFHWQLRYTLAGYGARPECLNYKFDDTPEGEFMETVFAAQGQLERKQNRRQVLQKMKARLEQGYWQFHPPTGYVFAKVEGHGKMLVRKEPVASIMEEVLLGFASGRFQTKAEVRHFLESFPDFPKGSNGKIGNSRVDVLFNCVVYAGYVEHEGWGVKLTKARHEPLIDLETFRKIQERLLGRAHAPARKNLNEDFPLRGFVSCSCGKPLTSGWSKGRNTYYAYYYCQSRDCGEYGKSIKREVIEGDFAALLSQMTPTKQLIDIAGKMLAELWAHRLNYQKARKSMLEAESLKVSRQVEKLLDRIVEAEVPLVMRSLEQRVKTLEEEKLVIAEKIAKCGKPLRDYDATYRTAMEFLSSPCNLWASSRFEDKRAVLKLTFADRLTYVRGKGYRTAKTTLPFKVLGNDMCR